MLTGANLAERKITFKVTDALPPGQGNFEHVSYPGQQLKVFTLEDLNAKKVTYQAPTEKDLGLNLDTNGVVFNFGFNGKVS